MDSVLGVVLIDLALMALVGFATWVTKSPWCLLALLLVLHWGSSTPSADDGEQDEEGEESNVNAAPKE